MQPPLEMLRWDRAAIADGEWWRLVTGHLAHLDVMHAALNVAGALFVWALFRRELTLRQWAVLGVAAVVTIDLGLWWLTPLDWYVGFSGIVHAMAAAGLVRPLIDRDRIAWSIGVMGLCKILYELAQGPLPFADWLGSAETAPVVTEVHALGAAAGLAVGLAIRSFLRATQPIGA